VISADRLTRRFGARDVVKDVTLQVSQSEIVALLGPNGAGKTTTLRMLAGLIAPTSGSVTIDSVRLTRSTGASLRTRIGFLTEAPGLWDRLTVRENLRIYAGLYGLAHAERTIDRSLDLFGLTDHASILLLDEPTSGLDPEVARSVRRLLDERRAAGCSILVSTHNLDEAERLADRVAVLHERLIAIDRPAALRQRLTTGRLIVRILGDPCAYIATARRSVGDEADIAAEGAVLSVRVTDPDRHTPALVAALVAAGAEILEVRAEVPALEDVYLHLMGERQDG